MSPGCGGTYEDCVNDYAPEGQDWIDFTGGQIGLYSQMDIREFPEFSGSFGCVHHEGLSCYYLEAQNVEDDEQYTVELMTPDEFIRQINNNNCHFGQQYVRFNYKEP